MNKRNFQNARFQKTDKEIFGPFYLFVGLVILILVVFLIVFFLSSKSGIVASEFDFDDKEKYVMKEDESIFLEGTVNEETKNINELYLDVDPYQPKYLVQLTKKEYINILMHLFDDKTFKNEKIPIEIKLSIVQEIVDTAKLLHFDPIFVAVVVNNISNFEVYAQSKTGRLGLLQFRADAVNAMLHDLGEAIDAKYDLFKPSNNLKYGLMIFKKILEDSNKNLLNALRIMYWGDGSNLNKLMAQEKIPDVVYAFPFSLMENYKQILKRLKNNGNSLVQADFSWNKNQNIKKLDLYSSLPKGMNPTPLLEKLEAKSRPNMAANIIKSNGQVVRSTIIGKQTLPTAEVSFKGEVARLRYIIRRSGLSVYDSDKLAQQIIVASYRDKVEALFIAAIIAQRSNFTYYAHTLFPEERFGLFQFTEIEAKKIADKGKISWGGSVGLTKMDYALRHGVHYIGILKQIFGSNVQAVLSALYQGPDVLNRRADIYGIKRAPAEVQTKIDEVIKLYNAWKKYYVIKK